jgi:hypothetical protein
MRSLPRLQLSPPREKRNRSPVIQGQNAPWFISFSDWTVFHQGLVVKRYHHIIKDLHFYIGLFISPFILVFAISAFVLNHDFVDWQDHWQEWYFSVNDKVDDTYEVNIPIPEKSDIDFAEEIIKQLNISGEIAGVFRDSVQVYIPVTKPGRRISIRADLMAGLVYIHSEKTNIWKKLIWLHKMPGPHNAGIRGNWVYTKIWKSLVDFSVVFLLLSSITGITLWYYFKSERAIGVMALLIGFLSIASLVIGLTLS